MGDPTIGKSEALKLLKRARDANKEFGWMNASNLPAITPVLARERLVEARSVGERREYRILPAGVDELEQRMSEAKAPPRPTPKPAPLPEPNPRRGMAKPESYTYEICDNDGRSWIPAGAPVDTDRQVVLVEMDKTASRHPGVAYRLITPGGEERSPILYYLPSPAQCVEVAMADLLQTVDCYGMSYEWTEALRADHQALRVQLGEAI